MIWLFWLVLMLIIAAAPGVYLMMEKYAEARVRADLPVHSVEDTPEAVS